MSVVLQSSGPGLLTSLAFVAVGVAVLVLFARRGVARLLAMRRIERRPVGDVEPGPVEIEGRVRPADETVSGETFGTGYADGVVTQYRQSGGPGDEGPEFTLPIPQQFAPDVLTGETAVPFYVEDDTGTVLVDPAYADISLDSDYASHNDATGRSKVEAILEPGDTVYVLGEAVPAGSYGQAATPPGGVVRSLQRLLYGGNTTADEVMDDDELVVTRTASSSEFLISDTSERRGQLRQVLMAAFWTLSGLVAIGGGLYFLVTGIV